MKMVLLKKDNAFYPYYESDKEISKGYKENTVYIVDIKQPRNIKHHKKYWALCKLVCTNSEAFKNSEQVSDYLKLKSGNIEYICVNNSVTYIKPKSINFEAMGKKAFEEFWHIIIPDVCELLGCEISEVEENLIFEM